MNTRIAISIILLWPCLSFGQADIEKMDGFIQGVLSEATEIPGISVAVIKQGKPYYLKSFGYADLENQQKANTNTSYYIASVTKGFVGVLAAMLHEEGLIDLEAPITQYAPIKRFEDQTVFQGVTLSDLLSHTSGLRNPMLTWQFADIGNYDRNSIVKILEHKTRLLHNNKAYRYDNLGYNIFDIILKEEFGLSWKALLQQRIFDPLGMDRTAASPRHAKNSGWNIARPYVAINEKHLPLPAQTIKNEKTFQAAGGMLASIADMQQWLKALLPVNPDQSETAIPTSVLQRAVSPIATNGKGSIFVKNKAYGLGWNIGEYREQDVYYHLGGFDGYFAHLSLMPGEGAGVAIMVNESHFGDNVGNLIAQYVYDLLLTPDNLDPEYSDEKKIVFDRIERIQKAFAEDRLFRSDRKFTLKLPADNYAGHYSNEWLGDIIISTDSAQITEAQLGILKATAEPSLNEDSIRVEFRNGNGRDILFVTDRNKVLAAVYQGYVFIKNERDSNIAESGDAN